MINKFLIFAFLLVFTCSSCQNSNSFSGYIKLETEISNGAVSETFLPPSVLTIDDNGNILEFNEKLKAMDAKFIGRDTLSVFLVNIKKGIYSAYKKLDANEKPFMNNKIENKKEGIAFYSKKDDFFLGINDISISDTIVNGIKYKFAAGSKILDNSKTIYAALVAKTPQNFPVQISKIISNMTDGGFVEKVWIIDKANNKIITFKSSYHHKKLPDIISKIMKTWAKN